MAVDLYSQTSAGLQLRLAMPLRRALRSASRGWRLVLIVFWSRQRDRITRSRGCLQVPSCAVARNRFW